MSLVNLAHVCSHLQNASLARLGLTSIPYTKWHLSLSLLLQKQGFLSQVKLGGPSPPASCFGQGPRDDHSITNYPHGSAGRNPLSAESALALVIRNGLNSRQLQERGFDQEAIEFAQQHGRKSLEEMEASGWTLRTAQFISDVRTQLDEEGERLEMEFESRRMACTTSEEEAALMDQMGATPTDRQATAREEFLAQLSPAQAALIARYENVSSNDLFQTDFDASDIESIAGRDIYKTEREIRRDGITVEAMGLRISNQHVTLPQAEYQDPDMMETEGVVTQANRASRRLWLGLKYYDSSPVLSKARMISKPTKRIWLNSRDLARVVRGGQAGEVKAMTQIGEIIAVSTDKGILEARECVERKIGGMPLCRVW